MTAGVQQAEYRSISYPSPQFWMGDNCFLTETSPQLKRINEFVENPQLHSAIKDSHLPKPGEISAICWQHRMQ